MVKKILQFLNKEIGGLHEAAYLLGLFAVLSHLLALVRDRLFAGSLGAGQELDLYYAAFRIPDVILISAASIVSISILVPFLIEKIEERGMEARQFINGIFTVFFSCIVIISAIVFILVPVILPIIFPGLAEGESFKELVVLSRIMLLQPIVLGLSNLFASITQVYKKFFVYAVSPLLYNIGIIFGIIFLYPKFGLPGLAWGVVIGAVLHLGVQVPVLVKTGFFPSFTREINWKEIRSVAIISLPRTLALGATNLAVLFLISMASLMEEGSISVFNLSWNLQTVPLAIVGVSYSIASFPVLSKLFTNGDRIGFLNQIVSSIKHIIFWSFPALVLFIVLRAQIVRTIYGSGEFGWEATRLVAASLAVFAISVVAQSLTVLFIRAYYAIGNTKVPLYINLFAGVLIVGLSYMFIGIFNNFPFIHYFVETLLRVPEIDGTEVLMLPLAYSIAMLVGLGIFWFRLRKDVGKFPKEVNETIFQSFSASVIMGFTAFIFLNIFDDFLNLNTLVGIFLQGFLAGIVGILAWVLVLRLLGNKEVLEVWNTLHRKFWKTKVIGIDTSEDTTL